MEQHTAYSQEQSSAGGRGNTKRAAAARPVPLGTDVALSMPAEGGEPFAVAFWDPWFALVAMAEHDGDLDRLAGHLGDGFRARFDGESVRRKRAHIRDLKARLARG